ncbi:glycoside hydrolase 5 family protein [Dyella flagellata]|uniref:Biofilm formation protein PslG n=1 Tax=Dyella flagellata TaxID=1867833 RepID=A0ABQ5XEM7_9GAMM|nr:beta-xylosidase [Dyella flagellata]GLQ89447.1 biofilm formation protein PslG [Dyella flagellata]
MRIHSRRRWLAPAAIVTLFLLLLLLGQSRKNEALAAPLELRAPRTVVWKDFLGVNAHFLWFTPEVYRLQMQRLQALGLQWTRIDLHWDRIEPSRGQFRWDVLDPLMQRLVTDRLKAEVYLVGSARYASSAPADASNSDQYPPQGPQLYANVLVQLARRYPQVSAWQVWNEPNLPSFWYPREDPQAYGQLLLASKQALDRAAPGRQLVLGGMAYFSQMPDQHGRLMVQSLGNLGLFSFPIVIAYHPYSLAPEGDDPAQRDFILRAEQGNQALRAAGVKQIWADEWGWSSYAGPVEQQPIIGEQGQADYLLRRLVLMSALDYDRIFLFALSDLDDRATARDRHYGLLDEHAQPKPAYYALARFLAITGPRVQPIDPPHPATAPPGLISVAWRRDDGHQLWMFWAAQPGQLTLPGIRLATLHDPLRGTQRQLRAKQDPLQVPVQTSLQILEWP